MIIEKIYSKFLLSTGTSTDTRKIEQGNIFFALKGAHFNGNLYAQAALEQGAICAIIDEEIECSFSPDSYIKVDSVLTTLQQLANYHRQQLKIPIIAITGSNGKTTSKELLKSVLSTQYSTFATAGNLNNHIGVPLSLLSIREDHEIAIIEMGANHQKEISQLCNIAAPEYGLITNIGKAHLEGFGGEKGVIKAKGELFEYIEATDGHCFVNMNDSKIARIAYFIQKVTTYGTGKFYDVNANISGLNPFLEVLWSPKKTKDPLTIKTQLIGHYNLDNVLAAISIGKAFEISNENIKAGIESYTPVNNRSQIIKKESASIILDAYNANPSSVEAALINLYNIEADQKVAILGDMFELGKESQVEHQKIAEHAAKMNLTQLVLVGNEFAPFSEMAHFHFHDVQAARQWFAEQSFENTTILIKGSRGMALEKILD